MTAPLTLVATWKHHGTRPPHKATADTLDLAEVALRANGWEVVGSASGYDVQANECDVSLTVEPVASWRGNHAKAEALPERLSATTRKPWKAADE